MASSKGRGEKFLNFEMDWYFYAAVSTGLLVAGACWCFFGRGGGETPSEDHEKSPLVNKSNKKTRAVIAKFEELEKRNFKKAKVAVARRVVERCPVCRKQLQDQHVQFQNLGLHKRCFRCRVCKCDLNLKDSTIQTIQANGKVSFQCGSCQHLTDKAAQHVSKVAGERVVVQEHEQGDHKKVLADIGDDLEQAVYFMTPRCAVCGEPVDTKKNEWTLEGRTLYHKTCHETGRPNSPSKSIKLPPSFCAKYLPQQIILKLSSSNGTTLTNLYFVWKDRDEEAILLRKEDSKVVVVPFVLDDQAPANPNYAPPSSGNKLAQINPLVQKKSTPKNTQVPLPSDPGRIQLELVKGVDVGPRCPVMPESAKVDEGTLITTLAYLYFGLTYRLSLQIEVLASEGESLLKLQEARLTVTIQDTNSVI